MKSIKSITLGLVATVLFNLPIKDVQAARQSASPSQPPDSLYFIDYDAGTNYDARWANYAQIDVPMEGVPNVTVTQNGVAAVLAYTPGPIGRRQFFDDYLPSLSLFINKENPLVPAVAQLCKEPANLNPIFPFYRYFVTNILVSAESEFIYEFGRLWDVMPKNGLRSFAGGCQQALNDNYHLMLGSDRSLTMTLPNLGEVTLTPGMLANALLGDPVQVDFQIQEGGLTFSAKAEIFLYFYQVFTSTQSETVCVIAIDPITDARGRSITTQHMQVMFSS